MIGIGEGLGVGTELFVPFNELFKPAEKKLGDSGDCTAKSKAVKSMDDRHVGLKK